MKVLSGSNSEIQVFKLKVKLKFDSLEEQKGERDVCPVHNVFETD